MGKQKDVEGNNQDTIQQKHLKCFFQSNYLALFENTQMPSGLVKWLKTAAQRTTLQSARMNGFQIKKPLKR